jgi:phosphate-selective porin
MRAPSRAGASLALLLAASGPAAPAGAEEPSPGFHLRPAPGYESGDFSFSLKGYVQEDYRSYRDWEVQETDLGPLRRPESQFRRGRAGVEASWGPLSGEFTLEFAGPGTTMKDAYLELRVARELRLRGGFFKPPLGPEFLTSASRIDFVERAMLSSELAPEREWGGMAHGELGKRVSYQLGVFVGDGRDRRSRAETTVAARVLLTVAKGLEVGGAVMRGEVEADPVGGALDPTPKGLRGASPTGYVFSIPRFVHGERLRLNAEAAVVRGPFSLRAEYLRASEERKGQGSVLDDLPRSIGSGWSAAGTWLLTGGSKKDGAGKPRRSLFRGPGALEAAARYESLRFDDDGPDTGFAGFGNRARNIRPADSRAFTGGLSWWPSAYFRIMGDVVVERYGDALLAPEPGRRGSYVTLLGRLQFQLP